MWFGGKFEMQDNGGKNNMGKMGGSLMQSYKTSEFQTKPQFWTIQYGWKLFFLKKFWVKYRELDWLIGNFF